jgi:hypothetical protein
VRGTSIGLGGAGSSAILAGPYCGGHVSWMWLDLWDGVEGWVLYALDDGGEGLSGWVMGLVLIKVWVEPSSRWRRWLSHLGGIVRVAFRLKPQWTPNVGIK